MRNGDGNQMCEVDSILLALGIVYIGIGLIELGIFCKHRATHVGWEHGLLAATFLALGMVWSYRGYTRYKD